MLNASLILQNLSNDDLIASVRERGLRSIALDTVSLTKLQRLDISSNELTSLSGLAIPSLTTLKAHHNKLRRLALVGEFLRALKSLDVSFNPVASLGALSGCANLTALIISNARLKELGDALAAVPRLSTLVVSNNQLTSLRGVEHLRALTALSASHNQLDDAVFAVLAALHELSKVRLNSNAGISRVPRKFALEKLELFDLGNCGIASLQGVRACQSMHRLRTLNLLGNPCCQLADYPKFCASLPLGIASLDSRKRTATSVVPFSAFGDDDDDEAESEDSAQDIAAVLASKKQARLAQLAASTASEAAAAATAAATTKKRSAAAAGESGKKPRHVQAFRPDALPKKKVGSW